MKKYLLVLGNSPQLALHELKSQVKSLNELAFDPPALIIESDEEIPFERLGGTVKAAEIIENTPAKYLANLGKNPVDFGFSSINQRLPEPKNTKKELQELGIKSRFVLPKFPETQLSSVVVKKQKLTEFIFYKNFVGVTVWVQDFESWNNRDYGRPAVEAHLGMLPPKIARQMVNIANPKFEIRNSRILDPFCGVGTILAEAQTLGITAIGSDINPQQVERTKKNLEWLGKKADVFVCDATRISEKIKSVDAVVTEPDLGPGDSRNKNYLEKLYLDCFRDWAKILKTGEKVVIVLPSFGLDDTVVKNVIDKIIPLGYSLDAGPFTYARPQAKVIRKICVFNYGSR